MKIDTFVNTVVFSLYILTIYPKNVECVDRNVSEKTDFLDSPQRKNVYIETKLREEIQNILSSYRKPKDLKLKSTFTLSITPPAGVEEEYITDVVNKTLENIVSNTFEVSRTGSTLSIVTFSLKTENQKDSNGAVRKQNINVKFDVPNIDSKGECAMDKSYKNDTWCSDMIKWSFEKHTQKRRLTNNDLIPNFSFNFNDPHWANLRNWMKKELSSQEKQHTKHASLSLNIKALPYATYEEWLIMTMHMDEEIRRFEKRDIKYLAQPSPLKSKGKTFKLKILITQTDDKLRKELDLLKNICEKEIIFELKKHFLNMNFKFISIFNAIDTTRQKVSDNTARLVLRVFRKGNNQKIEPSKHGVFRDIKKKHHNINFISSHNQMDLKNSDLEYLILSFALSSSGNAQKEKFHETTTPKTVNTGSHQTTPIKTTPKEAYNITTSNTPNPVFAGATTHTTETAVSENDYSAFLKKLVTQDIIPSLSGRDTSSEPSFEIEKQVSKNCETNEFWSIILKFDSKRNETSIAPTIKGVLEHVFVNYENISRTEYGFDKDENGNEIAKIFICFKDVPKTGSNMNTTDNSTYTNTNTSTYTNITNTYSNTTDSITNIDITDKPTYTNTSDIITYTNTTDKDTYANATALGTHTTNNLNLYTITPDMSTSESFSWTDEITTVDYNNDNHASTFEISLIETTEGITTDRNPIDDMTTTASTPIVTSTEQNFKKYNDTNLVSSTLSSSAEEPVQKTEEFHTQNVPNTLRPNLENDYGTSFEKSGLSPYTTQNIDFTTQNPQTQQVNTLEKALVQKIIDEEILPIIISMHPSDKINIDIFPKEDQIQGVCKIDTFEIVIGVNVEEGFQPTSMKILKNTVNDIPEKYTKIVAACVVYSDKNYVYSTVKMMIRMKMAKQNETCSVPKDVKEKVCFETKYITVSSSHLPSSTYLHVDVPTGKSISVIEGGKPPLSEDLGIIPGGEPPLSKDAVVPIIPGGERPLPREISVIEGGKPPLSKDLNIIPGGKPPFSKDTAVSIIPGGERPLPKEISDIEGGKPPLSEDLNIIPGGEPPLSKDAAVTIIPGGERPLPKDISVIEGGKPPLSDVHIIPGGEPSLSKDTAVPIIPGGKPLISEDIPVIGGSGPPKTIPLPVLNGGEDPLSKDKSVSITSGGGPSLLEDKSVIGVSKPPDSKPVPFVSSGEPQSSKASS